MPSINIYVNEKQKDFLLILAYTYVQNNQFEKAITIYKALWTLFPDSEKLAFCLSYLYFRTQQFETALYYIDTYLAKNSSGLGYLLKGKALLELGRKYEAKEAITHLLERYS